MCSPVALEVQAEGQDPGDFITGRRLAACLRSHSQQEAEPEFEFQSWDSPGISHGVPDCQRGTCWPTSFMPKGED